MRPLNQQVLCVMGRADRKIRGLKLGSVTRHCGNQYQIGELGSSNRSEILTAYQIWRVIFYLSIFDEVSCLRWTSVKNPFHGVLCGTKLSLRNTQHFPSRLQQLNLMSYAS